MRQCAVGKNVVNARLVAGDGRVQAALKRGEPTKRGVWAEGRLRAVQTRIAQNFIACERFDGFVVGRAVEVAA